MGNKTIKQLITQLDKQEKHVNHLEVIRTRAVLVMLVIQSSMLLVTTLIHFGII